MNRADEMRIGDHEDVTDLTRLSVHYDPALSFERMISLIQFEVQPAVFCTIA